MAKEPGSTFPLGVFKVYEEMDSITADAFSASGPLVIIVGDLPFRAELHAGIDRLRYDDPRLEPLTLNQVFMVVV